MLVKDIIVGDIKNLEEFFDQLRVVLDELLKYGANPQLITCPFLGGLVIRTIKRRN